MLLVAHAFDLHDLPIFLNDDIVEHPELLNAEFPIRQFVLARSREVVAEQHFRLVSFTSTGGCSLGANSLQANLTDPPTRGLCFDSSCPRYMSSPLRRLLPQKSDNDVSLEWRQVVGKPQS